MATKEISEILNGPNNVMILLGRDDLIEFATTCASRIKDTQKKEPVIQVTEQPISFPEAVKFLGKSRQTLTVWRKRGIIKGHILGGRVYFLKSELLDALKGVK